MSDQVLVMNYFYAETEALRSETIGCLMKIAEAAASSTEPNTRIYALFYNRDDDKKSFWVMEWYKDQDAFDEHLRSSAVRDSLEWAENTPAIAGYPEITVLKPPTDALIFAKSGIAALSDPYVVFTEFDYDPEGADLSIPDWETVVKENKDKEDGALFFGLGKDVQLDATYGKFEVYANESDFKPITQDSEKITGSERFILKLVGGFLGRD